MRYKKLNHILKKIIVIPKKLPQSLLQIKINTASFVLILCRDINKITVII